MHHPSNIEKKKHQANFLISQFACPQFLSSPPPLASLVGGSKKRVEEASRRRRKKESFNKMRHCCFGAYDCILGSLIDERVNSVITSCIVLLIQIILR